MLAGAHCLLRMRGMQGRRRCQDDRLDTWAGESVVEIGRPVTDSGLSSKLCRVRFDSARDRHDLDAVDPVDRGSVLSSDGALAG